MLNKIKYMFSVIGIKPNQEVNALKPMTVQEDQRDVQTRKRVAAYIEANHELLMARAMRPHGADCTDNVTCEKIDCFKWQPDKIVGKPYKVERYSGRRID